jgi:hypothetical protein
MLIFMHDPQCSICIVAIHWFIRFICCRGCGWNSRDRFCAIDVWAGLVATRTGSSDHIERTNNETKPNQI